MPASVPDVWSRYTLLTNLDYVWVGSVRTMTHALVLERCSRPLSVTAPRPRWSAPDYLLRGFSTMAELPTFDVAVPSDEFTLEPVESSGLVVSGEDGEVRPMIQGAILRIREYPLEVRLAAQVGSREPIDVLRFPEQAHVGEVWEELRRRVARYWTTPRIPIVQFVPQAHAVRLADRAGVEGRDRHE